MTKPRKIKKRKYKGPPLTFITSGPSVKIYSGGKLVREFTRKWTPPIGEMGVFIEAGGDFQGMHEVESVQGAELLKTCATMLDKIAQHVRKPKSFMKQWMVPVIMGRIKERFKLGEFMPGFPWAQWSESWARTRNAAGPTNPDQPILRDTLELEKSFKWRMNSAGDELEVYSTSEKMNYHQLGSEEDNMPARPMAGFYAEWSPEPGAPGEQVVDTELIEGVHKKMHTYITRVLHHPWDDPTTAPMDDAPSWVTEG